MPETASIQVSGNVAGSIVVGDHNFVVNTNHGTIIYQQAGPQVRARQFAPQPPRAPRGFVNRSTELAKLEAWIATNEIVLLHGPDGMGKSSLLKQAANSAAAAAMPNGVILLEGVDLDGQTLGPDDVIQRLFDALFESNPPLKVDAVSARTYLSNTRPLILMDEVGLSPALEQALPDLFPKGAILLSADVPFGADFQRLPVNPLPRDESMGLLASRAGLVVSDTNRATLDEICALLKDVSLALVITANVIRETQTDPETALQAIEQTPTPERDPIQAALSRAFGFAFSRLSPSEQKILSAAALTPGVSVSPEWLSAALGGLQVESFIERLKNMGLLFANSPRLRLPPGFRSPAQRASVLNRDMLMPRLMEYLLTPLKSQPENWEHIRDELGSFFGALEWAAQSARAADVIALARAVDPYLTLQGLWDAWGQAINQALEAARSSRNLTVQAWALHQIGTRTIGVGTRREALHLLRQAMELRRVLGDADGMAYTRHNIDILMGVPPSSQEPSKPEPSEPPGGRPDTILWLTGLGIAGFVILAAILVLGMIFIFRPARATPTGTPTPAETVAVPPTLTETPTPTLTPTVTETLVFTPTVTLTPNKTVILDDFCLDRPCIRWFVGLGTGAGDEQVKAEQAVVDDFNTALERREDDISVLLEVVPHNAARDTLLSEIAAGNGPDIVGPVGWFDANAGLLNDQWLDLYPYTADMDISVFNEALFASYKTSDKLAALPFAAYPSAIFYNADLFDRADISYPPSRYGEKYFFDGEEFEWNWETLRRVALRLTLDAKGRNAADKEFDASSIVQYGFSWNYQTEPSYIGSYWGSGSYTGDDGRTAQLPDAWRAAWEWTYAGMWGAQPFIPIGKVSDGPDFGSGNVFNSGRVAMIEQPLWYTCCISDLKTWDLAAMPSDGKRVNGRVDSETFRIWKDTTHPEAAFKFVSYLSTVGVQKLLIGSADLPAAYDALPAHVKYQQTWLDLKRKQFPWVRNWQVALDGLDYPDVPSAEAYMPNFDTAWARGSTFYELLANASGLDLKREEAIFLRDLQKIFDTP